MPWGQWIFTGRRGYSRAGGDITGRIGYSRVGGDIHGQEVLPGRSPNVLRGLSNSVSHQAGELCDAWTVLSGSSQPAGKRTSNGC